MTAIPVSKVILNLFLLSIFLIPFDSFSLFPLGSIYRPISFFPLIAAFSIIFLTHKITKFSLFILFGICLVLFHSIIMSMIFFDSFGHINKAMITLFLFFIMASVFYKVIKDNFKKNADEFLFKIGLWSFYSLIFISLVGAIQFLMKIGIVPIEISETITHLFSYRTTNRIQMVSGEPAMMVRNLLFLGLFIYFFYYGKYRKLAIFLLMFFLLVSGSTFGYVTIILFIITYILLFDLRIIFNVKAISFSIFFIFIASMLMNNFLDNYTLAKIDIVLSIFSNFNMETVLSILEKDGSAFQRIINPTIGFMSGDYTYYLGTGLDGYRYIYPYYIETYFPYALNYSSVESAVLGDNYITPKSLYSKVYSELGIVSFGFFILFHIYIFLKIKKIENTKYYNFLSVAFCLIITLIVQSDSIIYLNYFFLLILVYTITMSAYSIRKT